MSAVSHSAPRRDRRAEPRVTAAFPAAVGAGHLRCSGRVIDASEHGVLIEFAEPLLWDAREVTITMALPASEPWEVSGTAVRRCAGAQGRERLALRMSADRPAPRPRRRRPSQSEVRSHADLCTRAYELAMQDPAAPVPAVLLRALADRDPGAEPPADARALLGAIARLAGDYRPDQPR